MTSQQVQTIWPVTKNASKAILERRFYRFLERGCYLWLVKVARRAKKARAARAANNFRQGGYGYSIAALAAFLVEEGKNNALL